MQFFEDAQGKLHALDDGAPLGVLPAGCAPITAQAAAARMLPTPAEIAAEDSAAAKRELVSIDLASIRSIREYIAAKPDAPQVLKDREAAAVLARARVVV